MSNYEKRVEKLVSRLENDAMDGFLVTNLTNIFYLTGFSGTAATLYISKNKRLFFTDSRYLLIAREKVEGFDIIETRDALSELAKSIEASRVGFDDQITFSYYQMLKTRLPNIEWIASSNMIEGIRQIKDESELVLIRRACQITDQAFSDLLDWVKVGKTELEVANFLNFRMRDYGATGVSFETIVASGHRSAMPHGVASHKTLEFGDAVTVDFGCYYEHYASDMTRTFFLGNVTDQEAEVYQTVLSANLALIDRANPGLSFKDYDTIPRSLIEAAGYGQYFTHGIGHGLGLDVHELPFFTGQEQVLAPGMVITDEPGIYLEHQFGVRIEDDLLITENGCEVLNQSSKKLLIL